MYATICIMYTLIYIENSLLQTTYIVLLVGTYSTNVLYQIGFNLISLQEKNQWGRYSFLFVVPAASTDAQLCCPWSVGRWRARRCLRARRRARAPAAPRLRAPLPAPPALRTTLLCPDRLNLSKTLCEWTLINDSGVQPLGRWDELFQLKTFFLDKTNRPIETLLCHSRCYRCYFILVYRK